VFGIGQFKPFFLHSHPDSHAKNSCKLEELEKEVVFYDRVNLYGKIAATVLGAITAVGIARKGFTFGMACFRLSQLKKANREISEFHRARPDIPNNFFEPILEKNALDKAISRNSRTPVLPYLLALGGSFAINYIANEAGERHVESIQAKFDFKCSDRCLNPSDYHQNHGY
jgi:hypothetical protein